MGIKTQIENIRRAGTIGRGEQGKAAPFGLFINNLIFRHADDSGAAEDKARVLIWRALFAAGDHEPQMGTVRHTVDLQRVVHNIG